MTQAQESGLKSSSSKPTNLRKPSEDFHEVEEWKSGVHPEIAAKSKFEQGSKEHEFEQQVNHVKSQLDTFNNSLPSSTKFVEEWLDDLKSKIKNQTESLDDKLIEIQALKNKGKYNNQIGDDLNHEFDQFEEMVKEALDNTKNEI